MSTARDSRPLMLLVGAGPAGSLVVRLFPVWAQLLGLGPAELGTIDVAPDAGPNQIRRVVEGIRDDARVRGAFVRVHEVAVFRHACQLLDELDRAARQIGEIDTIVKRDGRLIGRARDPLTLGRALDRLVPRRHWQDRDVQALVLGAGGAGRALCAELLMRPAGERPSDVLLVDIDDARLEDTAEQLEPLDPGHVVRLLKVDRALDNDRLVGRLPAGSLIVNATGLGRDRAGSPITGEARFPERAIAWDLDHAGEPTFLGQARLQQKARGLVLGDGFEAFVLGWMQAVADVFGKEPDEAMRTRLERAAASLRDAAG
jgi:shikimate dehydrogenase